MDSATAGVTGVVAFMIRVECLISKHGVTAAYKNLFRIGRRVGENSFAFVVVREASPCVGNVIGYLDTMTC